LLLRLHTLREDERKRIALEIHDELGQALTSLKMELHLLKRQVKVIDSPPKSVEATEKIEDLSEMIDATILSVRRIATELRPPILDDLGLVAAIEWQSQEFERRTGIPCVLSTNVENIGMDSEFTTAIFRIFQEALTNIARHAAAKNVAVDLKLSDSTLILSIKDNGKGIQSFTNINQSLGILGMRERTRLIGGELKVFNGEKSGTTVLMTAPINKEIRSEND
jgi:signal transduction histidine kinase